MVLCGFAIAGLRAILVSKSRDTASCDGKIQKGLPNVINETYIVQKSREKRCVLSQAFCDFRIYKQQSDQCSRMGSICALNINLLLAWWNGSFVLGKDIHVYSLLLHDRLRFWDHCYAIMTIIIIYLGFGFVLLFLLLLGFFSFFCSFLFA